MALALIANYLAALNVKTKILVFVVNLERFYLQKHKLASHAWMDANNAQLNRSANIVLKVI